MQKIACHQIQFVEYVLNRDKKVSRNRCLRTYITRLGAIIHYLKKQGYEFEAKNIKDDIRNMWGVRINDYVYTLKKSPKLELSFKERLEYKALYNKFYNI